MTKNSKSNLTIYPPSTIGYKNHDLRKKKMPAYSFGIRAQNKPHDAPPAPNAYKLPSIISGKDLTKKKAPVHSIQGKLRTQNNNIIISPAPNAYDLQSFTPGSRAPCYSIGRYSKGSINVATEDRM